LGSSGLAPARDNQVYGTGITMKEPWRSLGYLLLVGFLPLAFWYALWPHRRRLENPALPDQAPANEKP
jgi:hypothetical protein